MVVIQMLKCNRVKTKREQTWISPLEERSTKQAIAGSRILGQFSLSRHWPGIVCEQGCMDSQSHNAAVPFSRLFFSFIKIAASQSPEVSRILHQWGNIIKLK